ncbi:MAG: putative membrane protein [Polyangiales bacterium]|jgi:putative membrane protein
MLHTRRLPVRTVLRYAMTNVGIVGTWSLAVYALYAVAGFDWMRIPFTPLSVMGIAVSFYSGFKNNSAYDRFWEGRKIWGGVVNESRSWANAVLSYVLPGDESESAQEVRRALIYRHLAWVNALRLQLRSTSRFHNKPARTTRDRLIRHGDHMRNDWRKELAPFVADKELDELEKKANGATHLVSHQGQALAKMLKEGTLDLFHQIDMMAILRELYALQGKAERIKKTPLPRLYAEYSRVFTRAFVFTVPFGLLDVFSDRLPAEWPATGAWPWLLTYAVSSALVGWVFLTMEGLGDASEDPFERSMNDVPMNALSVVIERDLRELLGEDDIPDAELPIDGILY